MTDINPEDVPFITLLVFALSRLSKPKWRTLKSKSVLGEVVLDRAYLSKRFWKFVDKTGPCWMWKGATVNGYGRIRITTKACKERPSLLAHRVSYILHKGPIPDGMCVCHSCDIPSCVNPDHLWIGSHRENMRDAEMKGRRGKFGMFPPTKDTK